MAQDNATDLERPLAQAQRQLSEALERQAATDEVLRVIASSPADLPESSRQSSRVRHDCAKPTTPRSTKSNTMSCVTWQRMDMSQP